MIGRGLGAALDRLLDYIFGSDRPDRPCFFTVDLTVKVERRSGLWWNHHRIAARARLDGEVSTIEDRRSRAQERIYCALESLQDVDLEVFVG